VSEVASSFPGRTRNGRRRAVLAIYARMPPAAAYARLPYAYALCPNPYGFSKTFSAPSLRWAIS